MSSKSDYEVMRAQLEKAGINFMTGVGGWKGGDQVLEIGTTCFHFFDGKLTTALVPPQ